MQRTIGFMLTDAVIKEIQTRTPYRVIGEQFADTLLTGTVTNVDLDMISGSRTTKLSNEMLIEVTINFEWINLQSGGRIVDAINSRAALFLSLLSPPQSR